MYAVIETGGKQYKVAKNDVILIDLIGAKEGGETKISKVLLLHDGNSIHVGNPHIKGAHVVCEVLEHVRGDKSVSFKYRKRKSSKRKVGHRQELLMLKIKEIETGKG